MIAVIDMKLGNVYSVCNALKLFGIEFLLTNDLEKISQAEKLIFPGVGNFAEASTRLFQTGMRDCIRQEVLVNNKPLLGICLGMQLLADEGEEGGFSQGLGLIRARVSKLRCNQQEYRLPHIGWNDVTNRGTKLLNDIEPESCFYFVHSYEMILQEECACATSNYGVEFIAAVEKENIVGTQFHPEKSQEKGLKVLKKFLEG